MPADIPDDEEWISADIDTETGTGPATAALLRGIEHSLRGAPENRRYDLELHLRERVIDDGE